MCEKIFRALKNRILRVNFSSALKLITIIGILLFLFILKNNEIKDRTNNARYTIGITMKTVGTAKSGPNVMYLYTVNNKDYTDMTGFNTSDGVIIPNGRYFVEFSAKNPENSRILVSQPVPDTMLMAPPSGWDKIP